MSVEVSLSLYKVMREKTGDRLIPATQVWWWMNQRLLAASLSKRFIQQTLKSHRWSLSQDCSSFPTSGHF